MPCLIPPPKLSPTFLFSLNFTIILALKTYSKLEKLFLLHIMCFIYDSWFSLARMFNMVLRIYLWAKKGILQAFIRRHSRCAGFGLGHKITLYSHDVVQRTVLWWMPATLLCPFIDTPGSSIFLAQTQGITASAAWTSGEVERFCVRTGSQPDLPAAEADFEGSGAGGGPEGVRVTPALVVITHLSKLQMPRRKRPGSS